MKNDPHRSGNRSIGQPSDLGERLRGEGCLQIDEALLVSNQIAGLEIEYKSEMLFPSGCRMSDMLLECHIGALLQHV